MQPMDEVIAVDILPQAVGLVDQVRGQCGEAKASGTNVNRESLALIPVVAQRYARKTGRAPVPVHLTIEQVGKSELTADVGIGDAAGDVELATTQPIRIVYQPRL